MILSDVHEKLGKMVTAWQMKTARMRDFSFFYVILDHVLPVQYYGIVIIINARNNLITQEKI